MRLGYRHHRVPGGVGSQRRSCTAGHPAARGERRLPFPLILTGPTSRAVLRADRPLPAPDSWARSPPRYEIIVADPAKVARAWPRACPRAEHRKAHRDSFFFNWSPTSRWHSSQRSCPARGHGLASTCTTGRKPHELAADLRRVFSGIARANVKEDGMRRIEEFGVRDPRRRRLMQSLDALLRCVVEQRA